MNALYRRVRLRCLRAATVSARRRTAFESQCFRADLRADAPRSRRDVQGARAGAWSCATTLRSIALVVLKAARGEAD